MVKYVFGHKNPDTDSICAAVMYGRYLDMLNVKNEVIKLGEPNNETKYILDRFGFEMPATVNSLSEGAEVVLVDHNEKSQTIDEIENYKIDTIIDHHKFNLVTSEPLKIISEPIGSTCSIVAKLYLDNDMELSSAGAALLLSGIISDTLYFRSPTTTNEDRKIAGELNDIAGLGDLEKYSLEMFEAKSDLGDMPVEEVIRMDYKVFEFGTDRFGIGVMETTNAGYGLGREEEIIAKLVEIKESDDLKSVFFSIVDILNEENTTLFPTDVEKELLVAVFGAEIEGNRAKLGNVLSRKKQIVPFIEKHVLGE